jgi:DNA polymerase-3 subunit alpha
LPRQTGQHAAGLIICNQPIIDIAPTIDNNNHQIVQYEMSHLEELGLIKMDLLGLSTLSLIKDIIKLVYDQKKYLVNLNEIKFDDQKVFAQLSQGDTVGIFQLESSGMTSLVKKIKPKTIEDISILLALYRPGPMKNIDTYIHNRNHPESIIYMNEIFKKYLSSTSNVIIYQEQMIEIIKAVCNYSLEKADIFRRIMSKKKQDELQSLKVDFLKDAMANNYSKENSEKIFEYIESFADYGFNHSHSLSYAYISYWMAYIKFYYPLEFVTILLQKNNGNNEKINSYVEEVISLNIKVLPPSLLKSQKTFSILDSSIIFGFSSIKGFGETIAEKIINIRNKFNFKNYLQTISLFTKNGIGKSSIETLIKAGAFDDLLDGKTRMYLLHNLDNIISAGKYITEDGSFIIEPNLIEVNQTNEDAKTLNIEQFNLIGVDFAPNKENDEFKNLQSKYNAQTLAHATNENGKHIVIGEIIGSKEVTTKYGTVMCFINIKDNTKQAKITY